MGSRSDFSSPLVRTVLGKLSIPSEVITQPELQAHEGEHITLSVLTSTHHKGLFEVAKKLEKFEFLDYEAFALALGGHGGFVMISGGEVVGSITFSDYVPEMDATIHFLIDPAKQQRWMTDSIYRQVFDYAFKELGLPRVSACVIQGADSQVDGKALKAFGFKLEGTKRNYLKFHDGKHHSVDFYGLLNEERRY